MQVQSLGWGVGQVLSLKYQDKEMEAARKVALEQVSGAVGQDAYTLAGWGLDIGRGWFTNFDLDSTLETA